MAGEKHTPKGPTAQEIAALPDLIAFAWDVLFVTGRRGANSRVDHPDRKLWEAANAAIAKAKGGEA